MNIDQKTNEILELINNNLKDNWELFCEQNKDYIKEFDENAMKCLNFVFTVGYKSGVEFAATYLVTRTISDPPQNNINQNVKNN